jgi:hypothetical protein
MRRLSLIAGVTNLMLRPSKLTRHWLAMPRRHARIPSWMIQFSISMAFMAGFASAIHAASARPGSPQPVKYVIIISVDGMGSEYIKPLLAGDPANELTTFKRLQSEGSCTLNARNDPNYAITLPNHVVMMTGRGVTGPAGHAWSENKDPAPHETFATHKGSYIASGFDVAHDNGLRTGIWSGKSKFRLFQQSYGASTGAPDITGPDNGRDKIDFDKITSGISAKNLTDDFIRQMAANPFHFVFFHYQDPDATGHGAGWSTNPANPFAKTLKRVDTEIGRIMDLTRNNPALSGQTVLLVTADHGGHDKSHGDTSNPLDYTIPFYAWGAGVFAGRDLYAMNPTCRTSPAASANPPYSGAQPIRNGDAVNLAMRLLGCGPVPGSTINHAQDLTVTIPQNLTREKPAPRPL